MKRSDEVTVNPINMARLENRLPEFVTDSIERLKASWTKHDRGEISNWDCDYCEVQSNINILETGLYITSEEAWYLREKYLRITRDANT